MLFMNKFYLDYSSFKYKYEGRFVFKYPIRATADSTTPAVAFNNDASVTPEINPSTPSKPLSAQATTVHSELLSRLRYPIKATTASATPSDALGTFVSATPLIKLAAPSIARSAHAQVAHADDSCDADDSGWLLFDVDSFGIIIDEYITWNRKIQFPPFSSAAAGNKCYAHNVYWWIRRYY